MPANALFQATDLAGGDFVQFHLHSKMFEVWRVRNGQKYRIVSRFCPEILNKQFFLDLIQMAGKEARPELTNTEDCSTDSVWEYKYL